MQYPPNLNASARVQLLGNQFAAMPVYKQCNEKGESVEIKKIPSKNSQLFELYSPIEHRHLFLRRISFSAIPYSRKNIFQLFNFGVINGENANSAKQS